MLKTILHPGAHRHALIARLVAGAPLAGIGLMHATGSAPLGPILAAQGVPLPELQAAVVPVVQIAAGLGLIAGLFGRLWGIVAAGVMLGAIHAHLTIDVWPNPDEPPLALPIIVLVAGLYTAVRGPGPWSLDRLVHRAAAHDSSQGPIAAHA